MGVRVAERVESCRPGAGPGATERVFYPRPTRDGPRCAGVGRGPFGGTAGPGRAAPGGDAPRHAPARCRIRRSGDLIGHWGRAMLEPSPEKGAVRPTRNP